MFKRENMVCLYKLDHYFLTIYLQI